MSSIVPASQTNGALNAEHYQTFEMAKEQDGVIGGDDIAQIRSYAAYARAQAQAIHKTIAATSGIDNVAAIKSEVNETAQTYARVSIYADQRIGEILREMPKAKGNQYQNSASVPEGTTATKREAEKAAGIAHKQAIDLQKLAANPEVVQAVIDKATADGTVVSRSQVLKAIKERDDARASEATVRAVGERLKQQVETLKQQAAQKPEPEVVEVTREVVPEDYEEMQKRLQWLEHLESVHSSDSQKMRKKLEETRKKLNQANELLGENDRNHNARRDIEQLTVATNTYLRNYGGKSWAFDQFYRVDEVTQEEFVKAIHNLAAFAQNLSQLIASRKNG